MPLSGPARVWPPPGAASFSVMVAALQDQDEIGADLIDQPVFVREAARPAAGEIVLQEFGLARAGGGRAQAFFEQGAQAAGGGLVRVEPVEKIVPGVQVPA